MDAFDRQLADYLERWEIPGAALTVAYKGKIIYSKGYGWANRMRYQPVKPDSIFRIASLSKSITAIGAFLLLQEGKLKLDQKVFEILNDIKPCNPQVEPDRRIYQIRVRDLLQCSAGWDPHYDPIFSPALNESARECSRSLRPSSTSMIRYMLNNHLDYAPGTSYVYSNFSYCVLGKLIERVSGLKYADFISRSLLKPAGLDGIKQGSTIKTAPAEVTYYPDADEDGNSVLPNVRGPRSTAYGGYFLLESAPSSIGWTASTEDLVKLLSTLAGFGQSAPPLKQDLLRVMLSKPDLPGWKNKSEYFAMGFEVETDESGKLLAFSRHGSLPGLMSLMEHQSNGLTWAACFNSRPRAYELSREEVKGIIKEAIKKINPAYKK